MDDKREANAWYRAIFMIYDDLAKGGYGYESMELIRRTFEQHGEDVNKYNSEYDYRPLFLEIKDRAGYLEGAAFDAGLEKEGMDYAALERDLVSYKYNIEHGLLK